MNAPFARITLPYHARAQKTRQVDGCRFTSGPLLGKVQGSKFKVEASAKILLKLKLPE
jgi:hypothetical protein